MKSLAYRIAALVDARDGARAQPLPEPLVQALIEDARAWRMALQDIFGSLSGDPGAADAATLRARLGRMLERLEANIQETLNAIPAGTLSLQDAERFYRLLGACRGLSEAVIDYAGGAEAIPWPPWRESRF
jgi:hypothetical protein